jgi:site-specific DNA-methyltransferase (adenine-specific)
MELELIKSDVLVALRSMPDESVDVTFTSPDYNLGIKYKSHQKVQERNDYLNWVTSWATEVMRVLKPNGSFFLNISGAPSRPLLPHFVVFRLSELAILQNTFHWIKAITIRKNGIYDMDGKQLPPEISVGHFKPLSTNRYVNDVHEYVFHFTKTGKVPLDRKAIGVPYSDKSNIKRWGHTAGADVRCRGNVWYVPYETIQNRLKDRPHPATFPAELAELGLRITKCGPESVVLDPFVGYGNAGIAASRIKVKKFIGIDIEQFYIDESQKRISDICL